MKLINRPVTTADIEEICAMPQNPYELYHMFPKANFPLTSSQLNESIAQRNDSTVFLIEDNLVAFANFYAVVPQEYCSIGNVIVHRKYRKKELANK